MHTTRTSLVAASVVTALVISGCGSDADPLTKAEFVAQANALCEVANANAETVADPFWTSLEGFDENDPAAQEAIFTGFAEMVDELNPVFNQLADDPRDLEPPSADRDVIDTLIDDLQAALKEMNDITDAAAAGDAAARERMDGDDGDPMRAVNARARDYGLDACGQEDI